MDELELRAEDKRRLMAALSGSIAEARKAREYSHDYSQHAALDAELMARRDLLARIRRAKAIRL